MKAVFVQQGIKIDEKYQGKNESDRHFIKEVLNKAEKYDDPACGQCSVYLFEKEEPNV